ncbi:MAG TPA: molybdenum cofactor guanylyltransferase [Ilumatobacteraceae bacterium]
MTAPMGAVLCGGLSRRMGTDKATMDFDGIAMARRVADALIAAGCRPVVAVGGDSVALTGLGLEFVADRFPGEGPLGGILTAAELGSPVLVVACDLPRLRADTIRSLVEALGDHDAAIAHTGKPEPLCGVWSSRGAALLRTQFDAGERAVHRALEHCDVAWVAADPGQLRNVNSPADLHEAADGWADGADGPGDRG